MPFFVALGVSGGPDSMALCVLTAGWKSEGLIGTGGSSGYIDGLLGIVVDHRLRPESAEEARIVQERVMRMGKSWILLSAQFQFVLNSIYCCRY